MKRFLLEALTFLLETLALWYSSIFSPYRLQEEVARLLSVKEQETLITDTNSSEILLPYSRGRFFIQYLLLLSIFTIPLIYFIFPSDNPVNWLLIPCALLTAYGTSIWSVSIGLHWPLLFAIIYRANPSIYTEILNEILNILPLFNQLILGFGASSISLAVISLIAWYLMDEYFLPINFIVFGGVIILLTDVTHF